MEIAGQEAIDNFIKYHEAGILSNYPNDFVEYEMIESLNDKQVIEYLMEIWKLKDIKELINFSAAKKREYLKQIKGIKGISTLQLSRITGLSRKIIIKALE